MCVCVCVTEWMQCTRVCVCMKNTNVPNVYITSDAFCVYFHGKTSPLEQLCIHNAKTSTDELKPIHFLPPHHRKWEIDRHSRTTDVCYIYYLLLCITCKQIISDHKCTRRNRTKTGTNSTDKQMQNIIAQDIPITVKQNKMLV